MFGPLILACLQKCRLEFPRWLIHKQVMSRTHNSGWYVTLIRGIGTNLYFSRFDAPSIETFVGVNSNVGVVLLTHFRIAKIIGLVPSQLLCKSNYLRPCCSSSVLQKNLFLCTT